MRPGDVVRHYGGRTSEVTNTDAEGRLVLADAMAYAVAELEPDVLVDVATLTGAMKVALGQRAGGYFANDEALAAALAAAAAASGEPLWRMPLVGRLRGQAQLEGRRRRQRRRRRRARSPPRCSSSTSPATCPWAHLDIASVGDAPADRYEWTKGPTGFGAAAAAHLARVGAPLEGGRAMRGLTVRWSLVDAPEGVEKALASYVAETSHARFTGMAGLGFKTWRMRPEASGSRGATSSGRTRPRAAFQREFADGAAEAPGSQIVGSAPVWSRSARSSPWPRAGTASRAAPRA